MSIHEYFGDWTKVIDLQETNKIVQKLASSNAVICPQFKNVFLAFRLCPLKSLRLVILSQDPYPTLKSVQGDSSSLKIPIATGIAFANSPDTPEDSYSPSLDILKESVINYTIPHRTVIFDPSLEKWESQGVLMLNSALTCEVGRVGSHALLWRPFITSLLTNLSKHVGGIVYVLMGTVAQSFDAYINHQSNYVVHIRHPSYYARTNTSMPSSLWQEVNDILISQNGYGIQWYQEY